MNDKRVTGIDIGKSWLDAAWEQAGRVQRYSNDAAGIAPGTRDRPYASRTASAPVTASAPSITVRSSEPACTEMFSAKKRARVI
jgi:hypothetical protein